MCGRAQVGPALVFFGGDVRSTSDMLAADCKTGSYWLDGLPDPPALPDRPLAKVDVAIVGSGYTGLNAAVETARGGRSTLVLDAGDPGSGCSTRNGGQISTSVKPTLEKLTARVGADRARAIRQEGGNALDWIEDFVTREGIACDFRRAGRYHGAHTPKHYQTLLRDAELLRRNEGIEVFEVPRQDQRRELGSDIYHGGVVFPRHAVLNPARYQRGLMERAVDAGVHITGHCAVTGIARDAGGFLVKTAKGQVRARDVIVATNGYTGNVTPWLRRRVIPIGSYVIATEGELPAFLEDRVWNQPVVGLLITTALALLLANIGNITQISTMASAGFLIIFGIVNAANFVLSASVGSHKLLAGFGVLACAAALITLSWSSYQSNPIQLLVLVAMVSVAMMMELLYIVFWQSPEKLFRLLHPYNR